MTYQELKRRLYRLYPLIHRAMMERKLPELDRLFAERAAILAEMCAHEAVR